MEVEGLQRSRWEELKALRQHATPIAGGGVAKTPPPRHCRVFHCSVVTYAGTT